MTPSRTYPQRAAVSRGASGPDAGNSTHHKNPLQAQSVLTVLPIDRYLFDLALQRLMGGLRPTNLLFTGRRH